MIRYEEFLSNNNILYIFIINQFYLFCFLESIEKNRGKV